MEKINGDKGVNSIEKKNFELKPFFFKYLEPICTWSIVKNLVSRNFWLLSVIVILIPFFVKFFSLGEQLTVWLSIYFDVEYFKNAIESNKSKFLFFYFGAVFLLIAKSLFGSFAPHDIKRFGSVDNFIIYYLDMLKKVEGLKNSTVRNYINHRLDEHEFTRKFSSNQSEKQNNENVDSLDKTKPYLRVWICQFAVVGTILMIVPPVLIFIEMVFEVLKEVFWLS